MDVDISRIDLFMARTLSLDLPELEEAKIGLALGVPISTVASLLETDPVLTVIGDGLFYIESSFINSSWSGLGMKSRVPLVLIMVLTSADWSRFICPNR